MNREQIKELKEQSKSFYKLNRLMGKVLRYSRSRVESDSSDLDLQYEQTLYEIGRLKGVEEGLQMTSRLAQ